MGPRIFTRDDSLLLHKKHLVAAQRFHERHGGRTLIIARFVPVIRACAPVMAGVGAIRYRAFPAYDVVGGPSRIRGLTFTGYFPGRYIPGIDQHIEIVILVVIFLSILPGIISSLRTRKRARQDAAAHALTGDP